MSKPTITYRTKLVRAYYGSINTWCELAGKPRDLAIDTLKTRLGYQSVKQLTDLALIEVLAIIQASIQKYQ